VIGLAYQEQSPEQSHENEAEAEESDNHIFSSPVVVAAITPKREISKNADKSWNDIG
jgi:hypothetical protein